MTPSRLRCGRVLAASVATLLLYASTSFGQCSYDASVYVDGTYSGYDSQGNAFATVWGSGIDNSNCPACQHGYAYDLTVTRADGQEIVGSVTTDGGPAQMTGWVEPATYTIHGKFWLWCQCYGGLVGTMEETDDLVIPTGGGGGGEDPPDDPPDDPPPAQHQAYGTVFWDNNGNGLYDELEAPIEGTTVYLTDQAGSTVWATYTTGSDGRYLFQGSEAGTYRVAHPVPTGYMRTTDDSVAFSVPPDFSHNFGITQAPPPPPPPGTLRLFLDADGSFSSSSPTTDADSYVPGANLSTGASVPLPQQVTLIAAFVDSGGQIVAPPSGVTGAVFSLSNTSAFVGIAMNSGTDTGPDFELTASAAFFGSDLTARVGLLARDYGGFTRVSVDAGGQSAGINSLPSDQNGGGNMIPDGGWVTWDGASASDGSSADDSDGTPGVSGAPNVGLLGDGLTRFEEYRGFMVRGDHRRTNPAVKDLFISSVVSSTGTPSFGLGFFGASAGLAAHLVRGLDEPGTPEYLLDPDPARMLIINFNTANSGFGNSIPGHFDQRALRVKDEPGTPGILGDTVNLASKPCSQTGGGSPNEIFPHIRIFVDQHQAAGTNAQPANTQAQIDNEIRRTIAHEIGHGLHIKHRNDASLCDDNANVGPGPSVMDSNWYNGPPASDTRSQFNAADRAQIRLHLRP